jgi:predicted glycosyltransferase
LGPLIWIDLDNSPHVVLFTPVTHQLEKRGCRVLITARDCFQVCGLAERAGLAYRRLGRHYGRHKSLKVVGLVVRALQLAPVVLRERPVLALSHGSRSQMLLAAALRMPWVVMVDYEHVQLLPWLRATKIIVPEVVPLAPLRKYARAVSTYPGIKEDIYVPFFRPDPRLRAQLGVGDDEVLAAIRPPATEAHYHNAAAEELFDAVIDCLGAQPQVKMVVLVRSLHQEEELRREWPHLIAAGRIILPAKVLDGLNLIWNADLVVSGGGTMNREAAALGVPVYSIFRGRIGAVDRSLAEQGRLVLLASEDEVRSKIRIARREIKPLAPTARSPVLELVVEEVLSVLAEGHNAAPARSAPSAAQPQEQSPAGVERAA